MAEKKEGSALAAVTRSSVDAVNNAIDFRREETNGTSYPQLSYEDGVSDALFWAFGGCASDDEGEGLETDWPFTMATGPAPSQVGPEVELLEARRQLASQASLLDSALALLRDAAGACSASKLSSDASLFEASAWLEEVGEWVAAEVERTR